MLRAIEWALTLQARGGIEGRSYGCQHCNLLKVEKLLLLLVLLLSPSSPCGGGTAAGAQTWSPHTQRHVQVGNLMASAGPYIGATPLRKSTLHRGRSHRYHDWACRVWWFTNVYVMMWWGATPRRARSYQVRLGIACTDRMGRSPIYVGMTEGPFGARTSASSGEPCYLW